MLSRVVLVCFVVLARVVTRVVSCCVVLYSCYAVLSRVVLCWLVLLLV